MKQNSIILSIKKSLLLLPNQFKKSLLFVIFLTLLNSVLDLVGLTAILPVFGIVLTDNFLAKYSSIQYIYHFFDFSSEQSFIVFLCILILIILIFKNIIGVWINTKQNRFSWEIYQVISIKMYNISYKRGFHFFNNKNSNEILNDVVWIPQVFANSIVRQLIYFINEFIILIIIMVSLLIYAPSIFGLLGIIVFPVFYFFHKKTKTKITYLGERINELNPIINKPVFDTIFGFVDVSMTGTIMFFRKRLQKAIEEIKGLQITSTTFGLLPSRIIEITIFLSVLIILLYGMFFFESKTEIITLISVFGLSVYRIIPTINRMMLSIMTIETHQHAFDVINAYYKEEDINTFPQQTPIAFKESIIIKDLSFKYPDTELFSLEKLNCTINKGDIIGIVGESGSGKTTFANLFLRLLIENEGSIFVDNQKLLPNHILDWKKKIGYVRQDVFLMDATLAENIAFGLEKKDINYNKLNNVIERASLMGVVQQLEYGVNSIIGERGVKLSGGQRQRIGIARALYYDAEILVFDEATSALDTQTEEEITNSIQKLSNTNLTMLIIAHRFSTLKYCNKIFSFRKGTIDNVLSYQDIQDNLN